MISIEFNGDLQKWLSSYRLYLLNIFSGIATIISSHVRVVTFSGIAVTRIPGRSTLI